MPGPLTTTLAVTLGLTLAAHQYLEHRAKGTLTHIHTNDTVYDKQRYGHILDYDKYSLIVHGQPTLILSGEFHYWRLPDKTRWRPILEQYRSSGLNCIRIYFHWGFHSPSQGHYIFDGNRDIDYLLQVCEELGLYVLAAPGPYICAETQAGGFPIWLAAKREIRLRHMRTNLWKEYDPRFMDYCVEYFEHILPILARHQITNGSNGCIIGLQVENEAFQHIFGYPIGLHDDMRVLAKTARDCGITVPLFTNDGFEEGSYIVKEDPKRKKKDFGVDLYGFDNEPTSWVVGRDPSFLEEWNPSTVTAAMDKMEHKVRSFGHANQRTPIFIPELQGGWFNHYGIKYTYDEIYRFYGDQYTRLMLETSFSQGCTMLNFYMFYGGTNWGTLGDPDVYTSYDYSASIREYGLMSGRLRNLRLGILFLQSFSDIMVRTDAVASSKKDMSVQSSLGNTICQQRRSHVTGDMGPVELTFIRNFSDEKLDRFELTIRSESFHRGVSATVMICSLAYKSSFIALGNYTTLNPDIHLILSATPIHIRGFANEGKKEVWIASLAASGPTEMAFHGKVVIKEGGGRILGGGSIELHESSDNKAIHVLSIPEGTKNGYVVLSDTRQDPSRPLLHIIFLDQAALSTLYCYYENHHSAEETKTSGTLGAKCMMASSPKIVTWGSYNAQYDPRKKILTVESTESQEELHVLCFDQERSAFLTSDSIYGSKLPYQGFSIKENQNVILKQQSTSLWVEQNHQGLTLSEWEIRTTDFGSFDWLDCPRISSSSDRFQKVNLDFKFTSGHILYRCRFKTRELVQEGLLPRNHPVSLMINMRNRVLVFVNGVCIGSHMTYSRQLLMPGAKMGYDPVSFGSHTFLVPSEVLEAGTLQRDVILAGHPEYHDQEHEVILVIDSFGLSRQPFVVDDIRNPRGLLSARVRGKDVVMGSEHWQVAGVDVSGLDMAYGSTGFPDEHSQQGWEASTQGPRIVPDKGVTWWRTHFEGPPSGANMKTAEPIAHIPLCCRLEGELSAMIILNDVLVGRYFGSDSPQHDFYLMDGLLHKAESGQLNELKLMIYGSKATDSDGNKVRVQILPWIIEDAQGELAQWSGNTAFEVEEARAKELEAGPFWTVSQTFTLPIEG
ncbi:hypothetical protein BGZ65_011497 [Modicella reniformis]|uniref:Glycoside hydrolase 35 catalytic domain-containing protein n=1 Tax=Modicella reniformis TaxID=1440133 RepID=A0A9P6MAL7_9FUNG|nr:hypothetical protein BGZ65_011497 [Modicella reniformis]